MGLRDFIRRLEEHSGLADALRHHECVPGREPSFADDVHLEGGLRRALSRRGIDRLFTHQARALDLAREGKNFSVVTPTASGKTLSYTLPVLESMLEDPEARALFVFPLKALEQDQLQTLQELGAALEGAPLRAAIYDGDTSQHFRKKIRDDPPHVLLTTPDMLHGGILAHHGKWEAFFSKLRWVVVDELHTYRGIFGSHMAQVLRRLLRIAAHYGASPRFVTCSATIANPAEFNRMLLGQEVEVLSESGAPSSERHFLFFDPEGQSPNSMALKLLIRCLDADQRTIVFTKARKSTELIYTWLADSRPDLASRVSAYRSGYLPEERREIEGRLFQGSLLGVVSTSALEMGIDIGGLDCCILVGYPGTVSATWQRGGRAGRGERPSAVFMVAGADALDQHFIRNPEDFFARGAEAAVLDPENVPVLKSHLVCAAAEIPLERGDPFFPMEEIAPVLRELEWEAALLARHDGGCWFSPRKQPHRHVNLREVGRSFQIALEGTGLSIGTVSGIRAYKECHEGAIYLHRGRQYTVSQFDEKTGDIFVKASRARYYTQVRSEKDTEVLELLRSRPLGNFVLKLGTLKVTETITGYEKRRISGQELISRHDLEVPPQTFETVGLWIEMDDFFPTWLKQNRHHVMGSLHAIEHACIALYPLFLVCDRNDVGGICFPLHPQLEKSAIFIYDGYPGGIGLAKAAFENFEALLAQVEDTVSACDCEDGCPSCIHSPRCGAGNKPLDKKGSIALLQALQGKVPLEELTASLSLEEGEDEDDPPEELVLPPALQLPRWVVFDLETQRSAAEVGGWHNTHLMRVSVAVAWDSRKERFEVFREKELDGLFALLAEADLVVGFNHVKFDYGVLSAYTEMKLRRLPSFDILLDVHERLGHRLKLDSLATSTLGTSKSADGLAALQWFKEGRMDLITEYCTQDVRVTRDLFLYGCEQGHLLFERKGLGKVRLPVDWKIDVLCEKARRKAEAGVFEGMRR